MGDAPDFDRDDRPSTAQPPPVRQPGALVVHEVLAGRLYEEGYHFLADDLRERGAYGARKYATPDGETPLTVHNGRDPLADAYEEFLDAMAYLAQETMRIPGRDARADSPATAVLRQAITLAEQVRVALAARWRRPRRAHRPGPPEPVTGGLMSTPDVHSEAWHRLDVEDRVRLLAAAGAAIPPAEALELLDRLNRRDGCHGREIAVTYAATRLLDALPTPGTPIHQDAIESLRQVLRQARHPR